MLFAITFKCGNVEYHDFDNEVDAWVEFPTAVEVDAVEDDCDYYPEDMDGDFDSAMASAGYGTDEDYGDYGQYDDYACQWDE